MIQTIIKCKFKEKPKLDKSEDRREAKHEEKSNGNARTCRTPRTGGIKDPTKPWICPLQPGRSRIINPAPAD